MKIQPGIHLIRLMAYKHKNHFRAVCLDLDLYAEGRTLAEAMKRLDSAVLGYIESIEKDHKGDEKLLDRPAPKKYWQIYELLKELTEIKKRKKKEEVRKVYEGGIFTKSFELTHA